MLGRKDHEIAEAQMELEEIKAMGKNLENEVRNLKSSNQVLERKLKAEQAEKMSMSNASFMSNAGLGALAGRAGGAKDILSNSIMELSMAGGGRGNTSIMDLRTGYDKSNMRDISNMSIVIGKKGGERSFISRQQDSFYSKKREPQKQEEEQMAGDSESMYSGSVGDVQRVDSDSDSDDCEIEDPKAKARSTGFF